MKMNVFKGKETQSRKEAADFLRQIAERIEAGRIVLGSGTQEASLDIPETVKLEVEIDQKRKDSRGLRHKLELELTWYEGDTSHQGVEIR
ncbi:amphi-Trp domain-containing protein [Alkalispirochaeta americana]|uniref:Amphi-Trp domain-containing protein n=1 Tax=Alkalispirochaeta americana TaxID=159291 RepID=A0A1N6N3S6_9SPIO|nr:amphi-Trp domain-containing protein [Alkalispirochaeta americana]SIP86727.1 amphi-Trp domain-containing protein [Alkalispirochaeta americana]